MFKAQVRFEANGSSLVIYARHGKSGTNVAASMKTSDAKAVTGARAKFPKTDGGDAEARKAFDALVETAKGNGWKVAAVSASRNAFDKIPAPPAAKPAAAAAPKKVK